MLLATKVKNMFIKVLDEKMNTVLIDYDTKSESSESFGKMMNSLIFDKNIDSSRFYIFCQTKFYSTDRNTNLDSLAYAKIPSYIYFFDEENEDCCFVDGLDFSDYFQYFNNKYKNETIAEAVLEEYLNTKTLNYLESDEAFCF